MSVRETCDQCRCWDHSMPKWSRFTCMQGLDPVWDPVNECWRKIGGCRSFEQIPAPKKVLTDG